MHRAAAGVRLSSVPRLATSLCPAPGQQEPSNTGQQEACCSARVDLQDAQVDGGPLLHEALLDYPLLQLLALFMDLAHSCRVWPYFQILHTE